MKYLSLFLVLLLLACSQSHTKQQHAKSASTTPAAPPFMQFGTTWDTTNESARLIYKERCNQAALFHEYKDTGSFEFIAGDHFGAFAIGHLFSNHFRDAVFRFNDPGDSLTNIIVLRQYSQGWDTLLCAHVSTGEIWDEQVDIHDYTGDGHPDLAAKTTAYTSVTFAFNYKLWRNDGDHFTYIQGFEEIVNPEYDKKNGLVYSYQSMGCGDMAMRFGEYKFSNDRILPLRQVDCACCGNHHDSCSMNVNNAGEFILPAKQVSRYIPRYYAGFVQKKINEVYRYKR